MKIQNAIETKLNEAFDARFLQVENESHKHSVPPNSETHFKVTLVSPEFEGLMRVRRHQAIYKVLAEELEGEVHALALHLYSPEEWEASGQAAPERRAKTHHSAATALLPPGGWARARPMAHDEVRRASPESMFPHRRRKVGTH